MHELTLAENIIELVEQAAAHEGATRVSAVFVEIGRLSLVDVDALSFAFEVVSRGGCAAGARFNVIDIEGRGQCEDCGEMVVMPDIAASCPRCGGCRLKVLSGREMRVKGIEIGS